MERWWGLMYLSSIQSDLFTYKIKMIIHGTHYTIYIIVTFIFLQLFFLYIKMGKKQLKIRI